MLPSPADCCSHVSARPARRSSRRIVDWRTWLRAGIGARRIGRLSLETGRSTDSTLRVVEPERPGFDSRPWADDSPRVLRDREHAALETAEVDPGILMYTEPPPGTSMPVYIPPDSVDPDMIWPPKP